MGHGRFRIRHLLLLIPVAGVLLGCGTSSPSSGTPAGSPPSASASTAHESAGGSSQTTPPASAPASPAANSGNRPCGVLTVAQETAIMGGTKPTSYSLFAPGGYKGCNFYGGPPQTISGHTLKFTYMGSEQLQCYTPADKANGFEADNTKVFEGMYGIPAGSPPGTIGTGAKGLVFGVVLNNGCDLSAQAAVDLFAAGVPAKGSAAATKAAVQATMAYLNSK